MCVQVSGKRFGKDFVFVALNSVRILHKIIFWGVNNDQISLKSELKSIKSFIGTYGAGIKLLLIE